MSETAARRILVAEDDRGVRDAIERALTFEGYQVATATDGAASTIAITKVKLLLIAALPKQC